MMLAIAMALSRIGASQLDCGLSSAAVLSWWLVFQVVDLHNGENKARS
jgi:hypothetical protein